jgi:acetyltransferase
MLAAAPLRPKDAAEVQGFVRALSLRTRRDRFFAPVSELSPAQLERLVSQPGLSIAAWEGGRIVGLAQYAASGAEAEFAVVVADEWQGLGLGEALLGVLVFEARRSGIRVLAGLALAGNRAMRAVARNLGFSQRPDEDPDLVRLERHLAPA